MSGHLYQLKLGTYVGEYVRVNGPWDTWGIILKLNPDTGYNLIRGIKHIKPEGTTNVRPYPKH